MQLRKNTFENNSIDDPTINSYSHMEKYIFFPGIHETNEPGDGESKIKKYCKIINAKISEILNQKPHFRAFTGSFTHSNQRYREQMSKSCLDHKTKQVFAQENIKHGNRFETLKLWRFTNRHHRYTFERRRSEDKLGTSIAPLP